jgi:hypothetical protein
MKRILLLILALLLFASPAWGMREIGYDDPIHPQIGAMGGLESETSAYFAAHPTMTPAEVAALDLEIKGIKAGTPLTLSSLTLNLSLVSGAYFITRASIDLNRYSGISGVQYSVAATGVPLTTAVFSGAITAGTVETLDVDLVDAWTNLGAYPFETFTPGTGSAITQAVNSTGAAIANKTVSSVAGALYKLAVEIIKASGTPPKYSWGNAANMGTPNLPDVTGVLVTGSYYATTPAIYAAPGIVALSAVDFSMPSHSLKKVLTPDATGILAAALTNGGIAPNSATFVVTVSKP